jgi:hypothetical protein
MQENREKVLKKNIVGVSWHQEFYQGNKRTRVLYKAFAPSGRRAKCDDTQGDALGYELLPLQGVWGKPKGCSRNIHYT